jgi:hypothetical protein
MKAIIKEVGKNPQVQEIENGLEALKELVGGYIEVVSMEDNILLICNEEGKMQGLPPNFSMGYDVIVGTAVFVAFDGKEDFTGLSDWQIETIMSKFY